MNMFKARSSRILLALPILVIVTALSGCSGIEPWVKPYERDRLADPIMFLDADPVSSAYIYPYARSSVRGTDPCSLLSLQFRTIGNQAGFQEPPKRDQELAGQGYNCDAPNPASSRSDPFVEPARERRVRLISQP